MWRKSLCTTGGNINWCRHCVKTLCRFFKKLKIELPYDPAIPLLGIFLKKTKTLIWKDIRTPKFIVAFTITKIQKQPKCPLINEWIKNIYTLRILYILYIYNAILLSHKKWNLAICDNMDGPIRYYVKWNKSDGERQTPYDFTHTWNEKQNEQTNEQT